MNNLVIALALSCTTPVVENKTSYPWNSFDEWSLSNAIKTCKLLYKKSPCLKHFIKTGKQDYRAICSKEL